MVGRSRSLTRRRLRALPKEFAFQSEEEDEKFSTEADPRDVDDEEGSSESRSSTRRSMGENKQEDKRTGKCVHSALSASLN